MSDDFGTKPDGASYTQADCDKQDIVDDAIDECLRTILAEHGVEYEHDMEIIGEVRDEILAQLEKHFKLSPDTVYP